MDSLEKLCQEAIDKVVESIFSCIDEGEISVFLDKQGISDDIVLNFEIIFLRIRSLEDKERVSLRYYIMN